MASSTVTQGISLTTLADSYLGGRESLGKIITAIADGGAKTRAEIDRAGLGEALGSTGETNVQGEIVQRLDALATETFVDVLQQTGVVGALASEELEELKVMSGDASHPYVVVFDPIDGSSNIDVAVSIGSIFGIYRRSDSVPVTEKTALRPGREQVAATYLVYGSSTVMIVATREGVHGFTLDTSKGEFFLTHPGIRIPDDCPYYSANEGNSSMWEEPMRTAVAELRDTYSCRYVGSLVADFHRNLLKGGIFLYPGDKKNASGKLRLLYEANPLGFVAVQAGGAASSGFQQILDIQPDEVHQRTPLIVGNKEVVERVEAVLRGA